LLVLGLLAMRGRFTVGLAVSSLLVPIVLAVSISIVVVPIYVVRYISFTTGVFWILAVSGLQLIKNWGLRWAISLLVLVGVVINLPALYADPFYSRADLRAAAARIESSWQAGDLIVHTSEFSSVPFDYYHQGRLRQVLVAPGDREALRTAMAGSERIWFVREFALVDAAEAERAALESVDMLADVQSVERFDFLGAYVFLAR
jgi:hypothetical protein